MTDLSPNSAFNTKLKRRKTKLFFIFACVFCIALTILLRFIPRSEPYAKGEWVSIQSQTIEKKLGLVGVIQPVLQDTIVSPFEGVAVEVAVREGQQVDSGQLLVKLDTSQIDIRLRQSMADLLRTQKALRTLQNWKTSSDVSRAKRAVETARFALRNTTTLFKDAQTLFNRGIIARMEVDALSQQISVQQQDLNSLEDELLNVESKGFGEDLSIAEMDLKNAQTSFSSLQAQRNKQEIKSSFAGIISRPPASDGGKSVMVRAGQPLSTGTPLLTVVSLDQLQVLGQAQEVDLRQLKLNMPVEITGDGFDGSTFQGVISSIGMQSNVNDGQGGRFDVVVSITPDESIAYRNLRLGMSARLQVITYHKENSFSIPHDALQRDGSGRTFVSWRPDAQSVERKVLVEVGASTAKGIEILGLSPGEILVPNPSSK